MTSRIFGCLLAGGLLLAGHAHAQSGTPVERLAAALRFPTVSHQDQGPDETAFRGLHRYLEQQFPGTHETLTREVVAGYSLLYTWSGTDPALAPILLTSHLDVVPAPPSTLAAWEHPPFDGVIADGFVWGRGALDNKGGVLATLEAVERLVSGGFAPQRTVYLAFGHDEELGGDDGAGAITRLLQGRGVELEYSLDEGMMILEDGLFGLETPVAMIGIAEKGSVSLRITARAPGGHSSMPPPTGAIGRLSRAVLALEAHPMPVFEGGVWASMVDALAPHLSLGQRLALRTPPFSWMARRRLLAEPTVAAVLRTTTAVTMAGAGSKTNILPREAWAVANFRIVPGDTSGAVIERVREILDDDALEIDVMRASEASPASDPDSEAYARIAAAIRTISPTAVVSPALVMGGTDSKHYGKIALNAYRFAPFRLGVDDRTRFHGVNERISVEGYDDAIRFYEVLIESTAGPEAPSAP